MTFLKKINKRYFFYIVLTLILLTTTVFLSQGIDSDRFRDNLNTISNEELMEQGREYYRSNKMDSALMIFKYIGDSFDLKQSDPEKRLALLAKNNVGIIYAFSLMDYPHGYEALAEAFDLAETSGIEDAQTIICHNIVEMLSLYNTCFQIDNVKDRINHYTKLGVTKALSGKEYKGLASLVTNLLQFNLKADLSLLKSIESESISDTIEGVAYARTMIKVAEMLKNKKFAEASMELESYPDLQISFRRPFDFKIGRCCTLAKIYAEEGNAEMAEKFALEAYDVADSVGSVDSELVALSILSSLPIDRKEEYARQLLIKKDSALTKGRLQLVSEIDVRRSLNKEMEANKRLSEQRTRLIWVLSIVGVLLLIFGILITMLVRKSRKLRERNRALYSRIRQDLKQQDEDRAKSKSITISSSASAAEDSSTQTDPVKYAGSSLSQEKMDDICYRLSECLNDDKWICDPDVSLARTASLLNVNTTYLSRAINERYGKSFSSLLSEYRIRIATRYMAKDSPYYNQTIEAIARSVGYLSRSSFIAAFKKVNGMTPSEYLRASAECAE